MYKTLTEALRSQRSEGIQGITYIAGEAESEFCSYGELHYAAMNALQQLNRRGASAGCEVILQMESPREFLTVFWACLLGRMIPVPLSVGNNEEALAKTVRIIRVLNHPIVVAEPRQLEKLDEELSRFPGTDCVLLSLPDLLEKAADRSEAYVEVEVMPDDIAFIQFSSGTTGEPKGVQLTHRKLLANIRDLEERLGVGAQDAFLSWMPLTHDLGMIMFHLLPLVCGVKQYLMPTWLFIRRPVLWLQSACRFKATILASPNFGLKYFLTAYNKAAAQRSFDWDLSHIRAIVNGAEPIDVGVCRRFLDEMGAYGLHGKTMKMGYGMAEACVAVCIQEEHEAFTTYFVRRDALNIGEKAVLLPGGDEEHALALSGTGTPLRSCRVRICDDLDNPLPEGVVGHIQMSGANITEGYYNNKEATDKLFTSDGWARSGDLGFLAGRHLVVTGRTKDIIFINGSNYYPHDIERIAEERTELKVKRMVACGIYNEASGTEEAALFVLYRDKLEAFGKLSEQIRRHVNQVMGLRVSIILPVSKIYQTTSGKLQRYKYAAKYREGAYREIESELSRLQEQSAVVQGREPEGEVEQALFAIWCRLLNKERFDPEDSFFEIGGTSILVMQMFEEVEQLYPGVITLTDIFASPSVALLSRFISGSQGMERISLHLEAVHLPAPYFEASAIGVESQYRLTLQASNRNRLRSFCQQLGIPEEAVCLALFANAVYEVSDDSKVTVYTMIDSSGWVIPFRADFAAIDTIEELLRLAGTKKKAGETEVYHIGDIEKGTGSAEPGQARCFLVRKGWLPAADSLAGAFDMIVEWEDVSDTVTLSFWYNASRMNGLLMRGLFQAIADYIESLISMDIVSAGPVPQ